MGRRYQLLGAVLPPPPPQDLLEWLFSPFERADLPYPVWMLAHLLDVLLLPNETFVWHDAPYRVYKALEYRIGIEPLYRLVIVGRIETP